MSSLAFCFYHSNIDLYMQPFLLLISLITSINLLLSNLCPDQPVPATGAFSGDEKEEQKVK